MKKLARWILIAVAALWVYQDPGGAAILVHHLMGALTHAAQSLSQLASGL